MNIEKGLMDWLGFIPYNLNITEFITDISIATHLSIVGVIKIQPFCEDLVCTGLLKRISKVGQPIQQQQKWPCGPEWNRLVGIFCRPATISLLWGMDGDEQAMIDMFSISFIHTGREHNFHPQYPNLLLVNQMQVADLQKAATATQHLTLAGYRGDHSAQKSRANMRLDYELTNLINMGIDE